MDHTDAPDLPGSGKPAEPGPGYEESDVSIRGIVGFGIGLAVATGLVCLAMWGLFRVFVTRADRRDRPLPPMVAASLARTPPAPRLEPDPLAPRRAMLAREEAQLTTYGWVDRNAGLVRIPIDRAMELLVAKGLPPSKPMVMPTPAAAAPSQAARPASPSP